MTPPKGSQAITVIADFVTAHGSEIDAVIASLVRLKEPLTVPSIEAIVAAHGALLHILDGFTTTGKTPRSFAAKYLHFHNPCVPIYDEYARIGLSRLVRWDAKHLPFPLPPGADREYFDFCVRFWRLHEACQKHGIPVSVKTLDLYLWAVPE